MSQFFIAADGTRLAYEDQGTGLPLLCLSGLTRTMADFDYLRPYLPPVRLLRMDYRGRGASGYSGAHSYTIAQEAADALALLDHLGIAQTAILGTSRGGLIGMVLAATAKNRLLGLCLNDIGPVVEKQGLERIVDYIGVNPNIHSHEDMARHLAEGAVGFYNVALARWVAEARRHFKPTAHGLRINYDPALRDAVMASYNAPPADLWPLFDACAGLPLALLRGENSDLLSSQTADQMRARRPDMLFSNVADRGHVPFLDESESVAIVQSFLRKL